MTPGQTGKRLLLAASVVLALSLGSAQRVLADNGPHGGYTPATDRCAACHRAHSGRGAGLLTSTATLTDVSAFCYSCHSAGTGAYTDARNGLFLVGATVEASYENTSLPASNRPLRGGGFDAVTMNPDLAGSRSLPVTSNHMVAGGSNTVWGYGSISSTPNVGAGGVSLTCTNCHNPHGNAGSGGTPTYRILKGNGNGNLPLFRYSGGAPIAGVDVPDESGAKSYHVTDSTDNYFGQHGASVNGVNVYAALSRWCAQCHTRYDTSPSTMSGHTDSGDALFAFRHTSNDSSQSGCGSCHGSVHPLQIPPYPGCISCHVAHGTGARAGAKSGVVTWPGGGTDPSGNARSALLRLDNRGICQQCHNK